MLTRRLSLPACLHTPWYRILDTWCYDRRNKTHLQGGSNFRCIVCVQCGMLKKREEQWRRVGWMIRTQSRSWRSGRRRTHRAEAIGLYICCSKLSFSSRVSLSVTLMRHLSLQWSTLRLLSYISGHHSNTMNGRCVYCVFSMSKQWSTTDSIISRWQHILHFQCKLVQNSFLPDKHHVTCSAYQR